MKKLFFMIFALVALVSCGTSSKLVILHTNDTHSHLDPIRAGDQAGLGGVIERAAFIDSVRKAEGPENVLLVHSGDFSQGSSYFTVLGGMLEMDEINALGYDAVTIGNHEFDNDVDALAARLKKLNGTKVVCANLDLSSFELGNYITPYTVVERGGFRIGIIGLETDIRSVVANKISSKIGIMDNAEVTNKWAGYLRKKEKCDLVVLLSHLGYQEDQKFVPQIHGVDIVIGGHSHTFVDDFIYVNDADGKPVPIITDGCWGLEMGKITVTKYL